MPDQDAIDVERLLSQPELVAAIGAVLHDIRVLRGHVETLAAAQGLVLEDRPEQAEVLLQSVFATMTDEDEQAEVEATETATAIREELDAEELD